MQYTIYLVCRSEYYQVVPHLDLVGTAVLKIV